MKLPIWKLKDPTQAEVLRAVAQPVSLDIVSHQDFQQLIDDMERSMYAADGIGLAAPQIGKSIRLAIVAKEAFEGRECLVMINPTVSKISSQQVAMEEGCLSLPKVYGPVARARSLTLTAFNRQGQPYTLQAEDLFARVIQHEVDHLNGRIFIDRASEITHGKHLIP